MPAPEPQVKPGSRVFDHYRTPRLSPARMNFRTRNPEGIRGFLVSAYRYTLRVEAYVGFLTDRYPPFSLAA
jgi:Domain of unknown function (DUF4389)